MMWWKITLFNGAFTHVQAPNVVIALVLLGQRKNDIKSIAFDKEFTDKMENS